MLIPQLNQPFFSTLVFGVEKTLFAGDYRALICSSEEDAVKEVRLHRHSAAPAGRRRDPRADGHNAEDVKRLLQANIPLVLIDRDLPELPINRVLSDNFTAALTSARSTCSSWDTAASR